MTPVAPLDHKDDRLLERELLKVAHEVADLLGNGPLRRVLA
jgi:hypothetical protein